MAQITTTVSSYSVTPTIPPGNITRVTDNAILVGVWSTPIEVDTTSTFSITPGTGGTVTVQLSNDSGVTWRNILTALTSTLTSGVSPEATLIRATASGATGTLVVDTPEVGLVGVNTIVEIDDAFYLTLPDGTTLPLAGTVGTGHQPRIAGTQTMQIVCDAGSDTAHPKLLFLPNCTNGIDPDTEDNVLASEAFNELSPGVYDLNIPGGAAGTIVPISPAGGITMIHFAFEGSGTYTQAAGATVTALEMVLAKWDSSLNVSTVALYIGESTVGAGSNERYRNVVAVGFTA